MKKYTILIMCVLSVFLVCMPVSCTNKDSVPDSTSTDVEMTTDTDGVMVMETENYMTTDTDTLIDAWQTTEEETGNTSAENTEITTPEETQAESDTGSARLYYVGCSYDPENPPTGDLSEDFEACKKLADDNIRYGYMVFDISDGSVVYAPVGEFVAEIMRQSKIITDYVRENGFTYGDAPRNPAMNCDAKKVSCDRFVGWAMYNCGYKKQPSVQGLVVFSTNPAQDLSSWCEKQGFEKIEFVNQLIAGDIVFVNPVDLGNGLARPGHTFIFAGYKTGKKGLAYRYDCGSDTRINSVQPSLEAVLNFMYAYRPVAKN